MSKKERRKARKKRLKQKQHRVDQFAIDLKQCMPKSERWFLWKLKQDKEMISLSNNVRIEFRIADFVSEKYKVIFEIDGKSHNTKKQKSIDEVKDRLYKRRGYKCIRIVAYSDKSFKNGIDSFKSYVIDNLYKIDKIEKKREYNQRKSKRKIRENIQQPSLNKKQLLKRCNPKGTFICTACKISTKEYKTVFINNKTLYHCIRCFDKSIANII